MKLRNLVILLLAALCEYWGTAQGANQTVPKTRSAKGPDAAAKANPKAGSLQDNLQLLNQWVRQPESIQRLYEAAFKVLAADPKATFLDVGSDPEVRRIAKENGIVHLGGPMLGTVTADGARVWLRTLQPASVEVRVTLDGKEKTFGPVASTAETDLSAIVPVTGLAPGIRHPYRVLVDGKTIDIPAHAAITPAPRDDQPGKVRIVFGSCYHRWGLGNPQQAELMRRRTPAAFLAIGDIAVQDRNNHLGKHRADYLQRDFQPAWRALTTAIPVYATWDDHDYFNNDKAGIPKGFSQEDQIGVHEVFRRAWNNPGYGFVDERRGVFLRTRIGPCDVIMTDERYFRTGEAGSFLGEDQMRWLEAQLLDCRGPFIILSSGTMWSDYVSNGKDSWGRWDPQGRERIFNLIEKNRIGGVLLISGDRHGARGFRIPRPSGFEFYEFEAASLGGRRGPPVTIPGAPQFYGIANQYAFGEFTIDATLQDPEVEFRLVAEDGKYLHEMKLTRSQLTPPGQ